MNAFIAITRCLKHHQDRAEFSFRGCYRGHVIKGLVLTAPPGVQWQRHEEYLLYVIVRSIEGGWLKGEALKAKKLSEVFERD